MSTPITPTEAHVELAIAVNRCSQILHGGAQLIAESEARAVADAAKRFDEEEMKPCRSLCDQLRAEVATLREIAKEENCPHKYYTEGGVIYGVHGTSSITYVEKLRAEVERLTRVSDKFYETLARAEKAEEAIHKGERRIMEIWLNCLDGKVYPKSHHIDELGKTTRLLVADREKAKAELATERARLQAVVNSCWSVHKGNENMFAVYCRTRGGYITPWLATDRAAIDAAMKEDKS